MIVTHIVHWPNSGITSSLYNFLYVANKEDIVSHIIFFEGEREDIQAFESKCKSVHLLHLSNSKILAILNLHKILHEIRPDIIHTHSFQPGLWARILPLNFKKNIVSTVHSPYPYFKQFRIRSKIKKFIEIISINKYNYKVICVSEYVLKYLIEHSSIDRERLTIIKNGIILDNREYRQSERLGILKRRFNALSEKKVILSVGRLSEEKGIDVLIRTLAILKNQKFPSILIIVGDGILRKQLEVLCETLGVSELVFFEGFQEKPSDYFLLSDIYVCTSHFEGLPMSIMEAVQMKTPVIANNVGGVAEILENNISGILLEMGTPELFAAAIVKVTTDMRFQEKLVENAYKKVKLEFNIEQTLSETKALYKGIMCS